MEVRGSDSGGLPMATTSQVVVVVVEEEEEETRQASDTVDFELQIGRAATQDSTEKTALGVAATAAVHLTNLFFLLRGDTDSERVRRQRWAWSGGRISVLFAFAALLTAAGLVLAPHTTVGVSAARRRVILVASAAALFVASVGTVLAVLDAQGSASAMKPLF